MPSASRVGRKPVTIPAGVEIKVQNQEISIKGPKGHLTLSIHPNIQIVIDKTEIKITPSTAAAYCRAGSGAKLINAIPGTIRSQINNAVYGVSVGFESKLTLVGVGYRAQMQGAKLSLATGFSHPVEITPPKEIKIEIPSATEIIVKGADKHLVGHIASVIRKVRPPEPYKGKGIRYLNEKIIRKETKKK